MKTIEFVADRHTEKGTYGIIAVTKPGDGVIPVGSQDYPSEDAAIHAFARVLGGLFQTGAGVEGRRATTKHRG